MRVASPEKEEDLTEASCCTVMNAFFSRVKKTTVFMLDIVAYVYALYCCSLFAAILVMIVFDIIFSVYVAACTGQIQFQLYAFLGVLALGPLIVAMEEPFTNVYRVATTAGNRHLSLCALLDQERDNAGNILAFNDNNDAAPDAELKEKIDRRTFWGRIAIASVLMADVAVVATFISKNDSTALTIHAAATVATASLCSLVRALLVIRRNWFRRAGTVNTENMWFVECVSLCAMSVIGTTMFWQGVLRGSRSIWSFGLITVLIVAAFVVGGYIVARRRSYQYHYVNLGWCVLFVILMLIRTGNPGSVDAASVTNQQRLTGVVCYLILLVFMAVCTMLTAIDSSRGGKQARSLVVGIAALFLTLIILFSSVNFLPARPVAQRVIETNKTWKDPYTICNNHWYRFNVTDCILIAQATYYPEDSIPGAFRNWFDPAWNFSMVNETADEGTVRAYHFEFYRVADAFNRTVHEDVQVIAIRGSFSAQDWLQNGFIWGDSLFFSTFNFLTPFFLPDDVVSTLVSFANWVRYGVFGDCSYFFNLRQFAERVIEYSTRGGGSGNVLVIGHSLGGGLSMLTGAKFRIKSVAVSGVGIGYQAHTIGFDKDDVSRYLTNIIPESDAVPRIDKQIGNLQNIQCTKDPLGCHGVKNTFDEVATSCGDIRVIKNVDQTGKTNMVEEAIAKLASGAAILLAGAFFYVKGRKSASTTMVELQKPLIEESVVVTDLHAKASRQEEGERHRKAVQAAPTGDERSETSMPTIQQV